MAESGLPRSVRQRFVGRHSSQRPGRITLAWTQFTAAGSLPGVREGHTAVYDPATNRLIIFGGTNCSGTYYNDVWILSNADGSTATPSWTKVTPIGTGPIARSQATAIYDSVSNIMTVYGGGTTSTTVFGDVWTLSNANGVTWYSDNGPDLSDGHGSCSANRAERDL